MKDREIQENTAGKRWTVGTLVYDRRDLAILFLLLLTGNLVWALCNRSIS